MKFKIIRIFIWKMLWLSFHTPGKTSCKMSEIVKDICVPVREKVRNLFQIFGVNHVPCVYLATTFIAYWIILCASHRLCIEVHFHSPTGNSLKLVKVPFWLLLSSQVPEMNEGSLPVEPCMGKDDEICIKKWISTYRV